MTSLTSGGALVGAVGAGLTADRFGRKMPIWAACVVFVVGTVLQTAAYSVAQFAVGRFVVGLGVGSAAMVVPLYIGELAPAKYRKLDLLPQHSYRHSFNKLTHSERQVDAWSLSTTCPSHSANSSPAH